MKDTNKRNRRNDVGDERGMGQRAPRSGGRIAAQRSPREVTGAPRRGRGARARGAHEFPIDGSAALRARAWESDRGDDRAVRAWDFDGADSGTADTPRLKVAPPRPVSVPRAPFVALILVVVVGGVLGILLINTKINENAFRLDGLQKQQAALNVQQEQLAKTIAEHEAPGNLAAAARKLGLVESGQPAFIRLPDGQVIGVPRPAQGPPAITSQQGAGG